MNGLSVVSASAVVASVMLIIENGIRIAAINKAKNCVFVIPAGRTGYRIQYHKAVGLYALIKSENNIRVIFSNQGDKLSNVPVQT